ncbi:MAG: hypothetical protein ACPGUD_01575 [Parashewanella sp.]
MSIELPFEAPQPTSDCQGSERQQPSAAEENKSSETTIEERQWELQPHSLQNQSRQRLFHFSEPTTALTSSNKPLGIRKSYSLRGKYYTTNGYQPLSLQLYPEQDQVSEQLPESLDGRKRRSSSGYSTGAGSLTSSTSSTASAITPVGQSPTTGQHFDYDFAKKSKLTIADVQQLLLMTGGIEILTGATEAQLVELTPKKINRKVKGKYLLETAWQQGSLEGVAWLINHGADISIKFSNKKTLKQSLCHNQQHDTYAELLLHPQVPLTLTDIHSLLSMQTDTMTFRKQELLYLSLAAKIKDNNRVLATRIDIDEKIDGQSAIELALKFQNMSAFVHFILLGASIEHIFQDKGGIDYVVSYHNISASLLNHFENIHSRYDPILLHALIKLRCSGRVVDLYLSQVRKRQPTVSFELDVPHQGIIAIQAALSQKQGDVIAVLLDFGANPFNGLAMRKAFALALTDPQLTTELITTIKTDIKPTLPTLHTLAELGDSPLAISKLTTLLDEYINEKTVVNVSEIIGDVSLCQRL